MRRILLLTVVLSTILLLATAGDFLFFRTPVFSTARSSTAHTPQPQEPDLGDALPTQADFPRADENCKRRVKLDPWVGTPAVEFPKTFRCVLSLHTCDGVKSYKSGVRESGEDMCKDFWVARAALLDREICCVPGTAQKPKCEPQTPWFDSTAPCKEMKSTQLTISGGTATLYMCGHPVFYHSDSTLNDPMYADAYRAALRDQLRGKADKVCCDKFNEAVKTGKPCDPRSDVDCDGIPNRSDNENLQMPSIDVFRRASNATIDHFPEGLSYDELKPPEGCNCKWEMMRGELKCNPDPTKRHKYEASWKCPSTGEVVDTAKLSQPGASCEK